VLPVEVSRERVAMRQEPVRYGVSVEPEELAAAPSVAGRAVVSAAWTLQLP
jgi:hypothetical protein